MVVLGGGHLLADLRVVVLVVHPATSQSPVALAVAALPLLLAGCGEKGAPTLPVGGTVIGSLIVNGSTTSRLNVSAIDLAAHFDETRAQLAVAQPARGRRL